MEAPLAGPFSPLVLAIGAAAVTGVVVIGVIAGPGSVNCIQRGDFSTCMSETFFDGAATPTEEPAEPSTSADAAEIASAQEPAEPASDVEDAAEPEAVEAEVEIAIEPETETPAEAPVPAPVDDAPPAQEAEATQESAPMVEGDAAVSPVADDLPSLDVVRVEPDGSAVIAGSATPLGEIVLYADDQELGTETAGGAGDWVFVTEAPLPSGGVELRVLDVETQDYAQSSILVVVQDDRDSDPLVIASTPGEASEILQGLQSAEPLVVAEGGPAAPETVQATPFQDEASEAEEANSTIASPAPSDESAVPVESETPATSVQNQVSDSAASPAPVEAVDSPANAQDQTPEVTDAPTAEVEASGEPQVQSTEPTEPEPGVSDEPAIAETPSAAPSDAPQPAAAATTPPTIDAVEIDGNLNFFAGAGEEGMTVRLYVENRLAGSTEVADGRWLIEAVNELTNAAQRVRIDMLNAAGEVIGRAEVNFVVDVPATIEEAPIVVAEDTTPEAPTQAANAPAAAPATPAPDTDPAPVAPATPAPIADPEPAPAAEPEPDAPNPGAAPGPNTPEAPTPSAPANPESATPTPVGELEQAQPDVTPETAVEDDAPAGTSSGDSAEIPTLVGVTEDGRTTSGLAIIRQGDNLWTIARRVYGEGIRYTQIFEANTDQIRDPDLIYPGQAFDLPGTDSVIGEDGEP